VVRVAEQRVVQLARLRVGIEGLVVLWRAELRELAPHLVGNDRRADAGRDLVVLTEHALEHAERIGAG
jgi:hypothetical protein